jgi:3-phosphoshikimate 1-carboxyvinyltransferase
MLRAMGADVETDGNQVCIRPARRLSPIEIAVPADPSSAAFFIALASLAGDGELSLIDVCLNPTRTGFLQAMRRMGAAIDEAGVRSSVGEDVGDVRVRPAKLSGTRITAEQVPALIDELPLLACVAAGAGVDLEITGAAELRVKESDRIAVLVNGFRGLGFVADERRDGFTVSPPADGISGGNADAHGDHRMAMAFAVAALAGRSPSTITGADAVAISYPSFFETLDRLVTAQDRRGAR